MIVNLKKTEAVRFGKMCPLLLSTAVTSQSRLEKK